MLKTGHTESREQLDYRFQGNKKYLYPVNVYWRIHRLSPGWDFCRASEVVSRPQRAHRVTSLGAPAEARTELCFYEESKRRLFWWLSTLLTRSSRICLGLTQMCDYLPRDHWHPFCSTNHDLQLLFFFSGQDPDLDQFSFLKTDKVEA